MSHSRRSVLQPNQKAPPSAGGPLLPSSILKRLRQSSRALWWEKAWYESWPFLLSLCLGFALLFSGLLPLLPGWAHGGLLALLGIGLVGSVTYWWRTSRKPAPAEIHRRLEQENQLSGHPVSQLHDRLAGGADDGFSQVLWQAHQQQLIHKIGTMQAVTPRPRLFRRDPFGLRGLAVAALFLAIFLPNSSPWQRLQQALFLPQASPNDPGLPLAKTPLLLDIWISPPAYTGQSPIFLATADHPFVKPSAGNKTATLEIPEGSVLNIGLSGGNGLAPDVMGGDIPVSIQQITNGTFQGKGLLLVGTRITLKQGQELLGEWSIRIMPDTPPVISFAKQPTGTGRGRLDLKYVASDDYQLQSVKAIITLLNDQAHSDQQETIEVVLPVVTKNNSKIVEGSKLYDSAAHRWAGLPVKVQLIATDSRGQFGRSKPVEMLLPQRQFKHPLAQAVIIQRRMLNLIYNQEMRLPVAMSLHHISSQPAEYRDDSLVTLGLRSSLERLLQDQGDKAIPEVQDILWKVALRIEDGNLSDAEQELRNAQQNMQEALNNGASDQELQERMQELREAMNNYMSSMQDKAQQDQQNAEQEGQDQGEAQQGNGQFKNGGNGQTITQEDLQRMLDQAENMARSGAREAAQDMLSQLEELMDNLTPSPGQGQGSGNPQTGQNSRQNGDPLPSPESQLNKGLNGLMQDQQDLMDRSFGQSQQGNNPGQNRDNAQEQQQLREQLGEQMRQMGELLGDIPQSFGEAEQAMREAEQAFRQGNPDAAGEAMGRALEQLQNGSRELGEMLAKRLDPNGNQTVRRNDGGRDPLGRQDPGQGRMDEGQVKIPDAQTMQKSRNILEELRRRAADLSRPAIEREYLQRLLQLF